MKPLDPRQESLLDRALDAVSRDQIDPRVESAAISRVWDRLTEASQAEIRPGANLGERFASCGDYQAAIPDYLAGRLAKERRLLLEDHSRECIPCRRALLAARTGAPPRVARQHLGSASPWLRRSAIAAGLLAAIGTASILYTRGLFDRQTMIARVDRIDAQLFGVGTESSTAMSVGNEIREGQAIRTSKDGGAVVRLRDGSQVELRERSEVDLVERNGETTINVRRGSVIVQAAKQHGHLYAKTDDCRVAVTGTIFAVNHGTKGSRVSVIEGQVRVENGSNDHLLRSGDQVVTSQNLARLPIEQEISWSQDRERYVALLAELKALNQELQQRIAEKGLRYDSRLLHVQPADTRIYAAIPNVSTEIAAMQQSLSERLSRNEVLARFWQDRVANQGLDRELTELVQRLSGLGQHLGAEIAVSAAGGFSESHHPEVLLLAEVTNPAAFGPALAAEIERLNAQTQGDLTFRLLTDLGSAAPAAENEVLLWTAGDAFAAASDLNRLREVATLLGSGQSSPFAATSFHAHLTDAYSQGAQFLLGVDLEHLVGSQQINGNLEPALAFSGFDRAEDLIVEQKGDGTTTHTGAVLSFDGPRSGAMSWLAAPAPMGSLEFISADANFAAGFVAENPAAIADQIFEFLQSQNSDVAARLAAFQQEHGIDLRSDLAATLGGEMATALDGPALPMPSWKLIVEVYDPARLSQTLATAVAEINEQLVANGKPPLTLTNETISGRTYTTLAAANGTSIAFTFDDGYMIAGPNRAALDRSLQIRDSGVSLPRSSSFIALLPEDGYLDFSAVVYANLGSLADSALGSMLGGLAQQGGANLGELSAPSLTCAYGEPSRIRVVSTHQSGLALSIFSRLLGLTAMGNGEMADSGT